MKYASKFFAIGCLEDEDDRLERLKEKKKLVMSNSNNSDDGPPVFLDHSVEITKNERKNSDDIVIDLNKSTQDVSKVKKSSLNFVNIFEETYKKKEYMPKMNLYKRQNKKITHNKERQKKNYRESNLHYMMTYFNESSLQHLSAFFHKPEARTEEEKIIYENFELEKEWKNIVFPILTPIYTNYRADMTSEQMNSKYSKCGEHVVEEEVCKHLMENFQIEKENLNGEITMSKGHVHLRLLITAKDNISLFEAINVEKQKYIVPRILYRYLCYEEKDYRFGAKSIMFSDENFYINREKEQEKKSVKLVMLEENVKSEGACLRDFLKLMK